MKFAHEDNYLSIAYAPIWAKRNKPCRVHGGNTKNTLSDRGRKTQITDQFHSSVFQVGGSRNDRRIYFNLFSFFTILSLGLKNVPAFEVFPIGLTLYRALKAFWKKSTLRRISISNQFSFKATKTLHGRDSESFMLSNF